MSFINKVKNFFYEEIEEDDDELIKREAIREEKKKKREEKRFEPEIIEKHRDVTPVSSNNSDLSERELFKSERTFNFPMDLGDDIFDEEEELKEETREIFQETRKVETKPIVTHSYISEDESGKKHFHPSPVISPVYGILDKNYTVDDVVDRNLSKTKEFSIDKKNVDFDSVRNKAYKELDDEIEKTLSESRDIFYNLDNEKKEDTSNYKEDDVVITYDETPNEEEKVVDEDNNENDIDLTADIKIPDLFKKKEEESEKEKEDLFNLIDNMYNEEDEEEDED